MTNTAHVIREGFFAFLEDIAKPGDGFALFGATHVAALACMAAIAAVLCFMYTSLSKGGRKTMLRAVSLSIVFLEALKQVSMLALQRAYWPQLLPLHLCGVSIFIEFIHAFWPNKTTGEILYSLSLPGAVAALMFSDWSMYPIWNAYCLQSFVIHALHVSFPVMLLLTGEIRPRPSNLWRPAAFLAVAVPIVYLINLRLNTNFFFVNAGSQGSPLEIFIDMCGNPGFLLPYAGLLAAVWLALYAPWALAGRKGKTGEGR